MNRQQAGNSAPLFVLPSNQATRSFRCNHGNVNATRRLDLAIMNIEAMRKQKHAAWLQIWLDRFLIEGWLRHVRSKHDDDVRALHSGSRLERTPAILDCLGTRLTVAPQTKHNIAATIPQIERLTASLAAVAQYGDTQPRERFGVGITLVINLYHDFGSSFSALRVPVCYELCATAKFCIGRVIAPSDAEETIAAYFAITPLVYRGVGARQAARRDSRSAATSRRLDATSNVMLSPSRSSAIGPPTAASGDM